MKKVQKASLLVITLSILVLGLSCGRAMARLATPERLPGVPSMGNFKTISVPQFQIFPVQNSLSVPRIFPAQDQPGSSILKTSGERIQPSAVAPSSKALPPKKGTFPTSGDLAGYSRHRGDTPLAQSPNPISKVAGPRMGMVNVPNARFRQEPSTSAAKIAILPKGEFGEIIEQKAGWTRLALPAKGLIGWVRDDLLTLP